MRRYSAGRCPIFWPRCPLGFRSQTNLEGDPARACSRRGIYWCRHIFLRCGCWESGTAPKLRERRREKPAGGKRRKHRCQKYIPSAERSVRRFFYAGFDFDRGGVARIPSDQFLGIVDEKLHRPAVALLGQGITKRDFVRVSFASEIAANVALVNDQVGGETCSALPTCSRMANVL